MTGTPAADVFTLIVYVAFPAAAGVVLAAMTVRAIRRRR